MNKVNSGVNGRKEPVFWRLKGRLKYRKVKGDSKDLILGKEEKTPKTVDECVVVVISRIRL